MVRVVSSPVDVVTGLIPHTQFTDVGHREGNRASFSQRRDHVRVLRRRNVSTKQHTGRVRQTFINDRSTIQCHSTLIMLTRFVQVKLFDLHHTLLRKDHIN